MQVAAGKNQHRFCFSSFKRNEEKWALLRCNLYCKDDIIKGVNKDILALCLLVPDLCWSAAQVPRLLKSAILPLTFWGLSFWLEADFFLEVVVEEDLSLTLLTMLVLYGRPSHVPACVSGN